MLQLHLCLGEYGRRESGGLLFWGTQKQDHTIDRGTQKPYMLEAKMGGLTAGVRPQLEVNTQGAWNVHQHCCRSYCL